jgi:pimeloyl-ACP methyl ester carboxylesterase
MPTLTRDGITLAYEQRGRGGPAIVLVHGWTCDRSFFAPQAEYFAMKHRVVSVDLRGHGESGKPQGPYPISTFADDVAHLIAELTLGPVIAVGHSMGGLVVLQLAAVYPDRVAAIVMLDPAPLRFNDEVRAERQAMIAVAEVASQDTRRTHFEQRIPLLFVPKPDPAIIAHVLDVYLRTPPYVEAAAMRGILAFDGVAASARCKVPALHIVGATPPRNPPHLMAEWLPTVVNGWTVGTGHFNQLEAPGQVNSMIEKFLRHYV